MTRSIAQFMALVTLISTSFVLVTPANAQICYTYRTIDIPTPSGLQGMTHLEAINTAGLIVGHYANQEPPDGYTLKRQRSRLVVKNYRPVPGGPTFPRGINRLGDTVGMQLTASGAIGYFRRANGVVQTVTVPGASYAEALGTNSKRDVVGVFHILDPTTGFLGPMNGFWRYKGEYLTINAPESVFGTTLTGINVHQDIVGWYFPQDDTIHGLHIVDGVYATLDVPGALYTFLLDINDAGAIVGSHTQGEYGQGFLYQDGAFYPITPGVGEIHSEATGINNAGEIVGNYWAPDGLNFYGFVATPQATCATPAMAMAE